MFFADYSLKKRKGARKQKHSNVTENCLFKGFTTKGVKIYA